MKPCLKKGYFSSLIQTGIRFNIIEAQEIGSEGGSLTLRMPYPFIFLGWNDYPSEVRDLPLMPAAFQDLWIDVAELLFKEMCDANINAPNTGNAVEWVDGVYEKYLTKYLNSVEENEGNPDEFPLDNINHFAWTVPMAMVTEFWHNEVLFNAADANSVFTTHDRLFSLAQTIRDVSDLRLWAPPGIYSVPDVTNIPGLEDVITGTSSGSTRGMSIMTMELKSLE